MYRLWKNLPSVPFALLRRWARDVMNLIELEPGLLMRSVFSFSEIYSGSKVCETTWG